MWRFFALSTAVVLLVIAVVTALPHARRPDPQSRYSSGRSTPVPDSRDGARAPTAIPVRGDAPWALSALPECFHQISLVRGELGFVRANLPPHAEAAPEGATLVTRDCRIAVRAGGADVVRGENALRVPAPARLYVDGPRLLLETESRGRAVLRRYLLVDGRRPVFER